MSCTSLELVNELSTMVALVLIAVLAGVVIVAMIREVRR